jgi:tripartite-type tricarboxylate transporter receptor subunit TctC
LAKTAWRTVAQAARLPEGQTNMLEQFPKTAVAAGAAAFVMGAAMPAPAAEKYPAKPIRIVVPTSPSSGPDIIARLTGGMLTEAWGQQVVADNRAGAAGNIGAEIAARAAPDGYTLLAASSQQVSGPLYNDKAGYNLLRNFAPISLIASTPYVLSVHPSVPVHSVRELLALARARPGTLQFGSSGTGGGPHLAAELMRIMSGFDFMHVPYKAATFALIDVAGGQVQWAFTVLPAALPMIKTGKVRALAVTSKKRTPLAPELEAIGETIPGYEAIGWYGLVAPAKTPPYIVAMLNAEIIKALKRPEVIEKIRVLGADPIGANPAEFTAFITEQIELTRKIIDAAGLRAK